MKTIKDLEDVKFVEVGYWFLNNSNNKIDFSIETEYLEYDDILYAFESKGVVRYIGITEQTLRARMINYKSGHEENKSSGVTNKNVNKEIKKLLTDKFDVKIFILKGEAECNYHGFRISLSTGIEKSLINAFDFDSNLWNKRGVKDNRMKTSETTNNDKKSKNIKTDNQMIATLGKEGFNKGFILFKDSVDNLLPLDSAGMDIHYKSKKISGWFTRSGKNKKVNGYSELRFIINSDFNFGDNVLVTILNQNEIKIEKINAK